MALAIDTTKPTNSSTLHGATTSVALTMSTDGTNRIILVFVATETATTAVTVSSVTATGLTFAKRSSLVWTSNTSYQGDMEVWWAYAASQQTNVSITISLSGQCDSGVVCACAVSGVQNFSNPWDSNVSLPATASNGTSTTTTPSISGVSTTFNNSMIIGFWASGSNPSQAVSAGTGYTVLINLGTNISGAVHDAQGYTETQLFSSPQSSVSVPFGGSLKWWGAIADAITADVVSTVRSSGRMMMGIG